MPSPEVVFIQLNSSDIICTGYCRRRSGAEIEVDPMQDDLADVLHGSAADQSMEAMEAGSLAMKS